VVSLREVLLLKFKANKESSGNANLKLVSEKKLCKVIENITSNNFSLSSKVVALIAAYSQHGKCRAIILLVQQANSPIINFWNILYDKCLHTINSEDSDSHLYQRICCLQLLTETLSKRYVYDNLDYHMVIRHYFNIFLNSNHLSYLKIHASKGFSKFCKTRPDIVDEILPEYSRKLTNRLKEYPFYKSTDFSNNGTLMDFMRQFDAYFEREKPRKIRKYMIVNKIQNYFIFLLRFIREKKENENFVEQLIDRANVVEKKTRVVNPMQYYVPKTHAHHYDGEEISLSRTAPFQPNSTDTMERLKEFVNNQYFCNSLISEHSNTDEVSSTTSSNRTTRIESGQFGHSVMYNKNSHKKRKDEFVKEEQKTKVTMSLLEQLQEEHGDPSVRQALGNGSLADQINNITKVQIPQLAQYVEKQRKEIAEFDPGITRLYLKRSEDLGILEKDTNRLNRVTSKIKFK